MYHDALQDDTKYQWRDKEKKSEDLFLHLPQKKEIDFCWSQFFFFSLFFLHLTLLLFFPYPLIIFSSFPD